MISYCVFLDCNSLLVLCRIEDVVEYRRRHTHEFMVSVHRLAEIPLGRAVRVSPLGAVAAEFLRLAESGRKLGLASVALTAMAGPCADEIRNTDRCGLHRNNASIVLICVYAMF